ncbi:uncharacterized protein LOC131583690 [Poecile atricapillus]|uniref:uncharacterized protein LOC131583690 n=1 Tax=Poecile atricapillus TaxID=48891 RepID=UPI002739FB71|nr:uncharacterized protein LOC131583690 [Poecile atricapillus]
MPFFCQKALYHKLVSIWLCPKGTKRINGSSVSNNSEALSFRCRPAPRLGTPRCRERYHIPLSSSGGAAAPTHRPVGPARPPALCCNGRGTNGSIPFRGRAPLCLLGVGVRAGRRRSTLGTQPRPPRAQCSRSGAGERQAELKVLLQNVQSLSTSVQSKWDLKFLFRRLFKTVHQEIPKTGPCSIPHLLPTHSECDGCCLDAASQLLQGESQGPAGPQVSQILVYSCSNSQGIQALLPASAPGNCCSLQSWKCHVQVSQPPPSWCHRDIERPPAIHESSQK